jgi:lysophospholipase L1-like esterase
LTPVSNYDLKLAMYAGKPDKKIVFFGDSHVEFGDWNELFHRNDISNRGIAGENSAGLLQRLREKSPANKNIFVLVGTNDINNLTLAQSRENIKAIVDILAARNSVNLISTPIQLNPATVAEVEGLNAMEKEICAASACKFVGINDVLEKDGLLNPAYTLDGIHLSLAGYQTLAGILLPTMPTADE